MEPAGGVPWPARGAPGDGSLIRRGLPSSPAWEPPVKKLRNDAFQATPDATFPTQNSVHHARSNKVSPVPSVHATGESFYGGQESFGPLRPDQSMRAYGGQEHMPTNSYSQEKPQAGAHSFNMAPPAGSTHSTGFPPAGSTYSTGFPPGSAKSTASLFLKTKLCTKFKLGTCTFNERCHFAHGMEDLRKPPVGWEEMVASAGQSGPVFGRSNDGNIQRKKSNKPCRFFADGKECPYGDRCTFMHVLGEELYPISGFGNSESGGLSASRLKTRMCAAWERGEACNYGERCHYAHGYAELQSNTGGSAYPKSYVTPVPSTLQSSNTHLEAASAPYSTQFLNPENINAPSAAAPVGCSFPMANSIAPSNPYPVMSMVPQQPINAPTLNQGNWSATPVQGIFPGAQIAGLWTGHTSAAGGYSQDASSATQKLPAQVHQQPTVQSYATENVSLYQDPKQSLILHYGEGSGSGNFQSEALGGNGSYHATTYLPNYAN